LAGGAITTFLDGIFNRGTLAGAADGAAPSLRMSAGALTLQLRAVFGFAGAT
jgi:hypothetical protein